MANIQTILLAVLIVLNVVILIQVRAFFKELRTPVVKKLTPDLNLKARRVNIPDNRQNGGRENRPQPQNQQTRNHQNGNGQRPNNGNGGNGQSSNRDDRNRNRDDRNRNRNRDDRNRNRRPEIMGNEASEAQKAAEETVMISEEPAHQAEVKVAQAAFEGRRPLEPRISEPEPVQQTQETSAADSTATDNGVDFDPARIRHGRRPIVKKIPQFEEETGAVN